MVKNRVEEGDGMLKLYETYPDTNISKRTRRNTLKFDAPRKML